MVAFQQNMQWMPHKKNWDIWVSEILVQQLGYVTVKANINILTEVLARMILLNGWSNLSSVSVYSKKSLLLESKNISKSRKD